MIMIARYDDLPLGLYEKILELAQTPDNDVAIVAALSGRTEDELLNAPIAEYRTLADAASFLFYAPKPAKIRRSYEFGGKAYRLQADGRRMTTAQYIDFKELAKSGTASLADFLAVVLIPEGMQYNDGYDVLDVKAAITESLPVQEALGIRDFFTERLGRLTAGSLTCSRQMVERMRDSEARARLTRELTDAEALLTSGAGLPTWTMWRKSHAALGTMYM